MSDARILLIGGGGREHAIAWKLAQSNDVGNIYVAPGNSGTSFTPKTTNVDLDLNSHQEIASWCLENKIHMVAIGPEDPLADGIVNCLESSGILCFGPVQQAAQIEASKDFAKNFMQRNGIPTAQFRSFTEPSEAKDHIRNASYPALVVKASGLAAGKGVVVAGDSDEACQAVDELAKLPAGGKLVVEELLKGEEVSVLAFCDGIRSVTMLPAQDHKQLLDGDQGPNTGGMGAYCPSNLLSKEELEFVSQSIIQQVIDGLRKEGITYKGVLYAGLMKTDNGIKVLEFNCRFGDPEAEVILPLLQSDLYEIMKACAQGNLSENLKWSNKVSVGIVMCSAGYPGPCKKGFLIEGADLKAAEELKTFVGKSKQLTCDFDIIFHAGMTNKDMNLVTNGGRVLCAVAVASSITEATGRARSKVSRISFPGAHFRKDIGHRQIMRNLLTEGSLTYSKAGVSIDTASDFIRIIRADVERTKRLGSRGTIGGFGGVFDLRASGYTDPLLVSGTDGVGTKIKVAQAVGNHGTIGIDLVAMCVNDVLAEGAEPLFFLDYFACGQLNVNVASQIVSGVAEGCLRAGCALTGGETAEMPGVYSAGEYDLAGFAVGAVSRDNLLPKKDQMTDGDILIGLASSGVHSNGLSLARKVVEQSGLVYTSSAPFAINQTIGEALLTPTKIYVKSVLPILKTNRIKGVAHITGGGLYENITRVLPKTMLAELDATCWEIPAVFGWLSVTGQINQREMLRTFNCGLGLVLIVSSKDADSVLSDLPADSQASIVGRLRKRSNEDDPEVTIHHFDTAMKAVMRPFIHSLVDRETGRKRVAVLISGSGTNLQALIDRTMDATIKNSSRIVLVISNVPSALGLDRASRAGIETQIINNKLYSNRLDFDMALHELLQKYDIDLVCLAGFMRILTPQFTSLWRGRLINIHPALLPSFKGVHAQRQALEAGVRISGCTVHFVEAEVDAGAIISQEAVPILPEDDEATLTERIKRAEHKIFPEALEAVASGLIKLNEQGKILHI